MRSKCSTRRQGLGRLRGWAPPAGRPSARSQCSFGFSMSDGVDRPVSAAAACLEAVVRDSRASV